MIALTFSNIFANFVVGKVATVPRHFGKIKKRYAYLVIGNLRNFRFDARDSIVVLTHRAWATIVTSASKAFSGPPIRRAIAAHVLLCRMNRHFNKHIEGIDLEFWHELIECYGQMLTLNRGDFVCQFDRPTNKVGYVKSGYLIYTIAGYEKIGGFTFPGALFGDYPNCMHNLPARFDILAGRKTEVWVMDATILPTLYGEDTVINHHGHRFAEAAYNSLIERYCSFLAGTPVDRYIALTKQHPQIEQDVPQKEIAEYLQITPTHLSRIRKDLLKTLNQE